MKLLSTNADTQCSQPRSCQRPLHIISHPRLSHSYTLYQGAYLLMHILRDNIGLVWWRMCMSKQCQWLGSADLNRTIWLVDARTNITSLHLLFRRICFHGKQEKQLAFAHWNGALLSHREVQREAQGRCRRQARLEPSTTAPRTFAVCRDGPEGWKLRQ